MTSMILIPLGTETRKAVFLRRYKRFIVEAEDAGELLPVHCNNSGSMTGLLRIGAQIIVSKAPRTGRRFPYTLEMIRCGDVWVGVNTLVPNRLLRRAWEEGLLPELNDYTEFKPEASCGESRLDARLSGPRGVLWVEAKNVTLVEDDTAAFPDAVTSRGLKHLGELTARVHNGDRAACFYLLAGGLHRSRLRRGTV